MMAYILRCTDRDGGKNYVQSPGALASYGRLETAYLFETKEQARRNACGNEVVEEYFPAELPKRVDFD